MRILSFCFFLCLSLLRPQTTTAQTRTFPLPDVPTVLNTPQTRADYLALHYWDRYDFSNNDLIGDKDISEQGFSNFISIMPHVTQREEAFDALAKRMAANKRMLEYFLALAEKYLYEPLSPVYDEGLYIMMLERTAECRSVPARMREELRFDVKMARKNRLGSVAADFEFADREGRGGRLSDLRGRQVLLFMGDPECDACVAAKEKLALSPVVCNLVGSNRLTVLYVCVEGRTDSWLKGGAPEGWLYVCDEKTDIYRKQLYEMRGLPVLFLLDADGRVLMKNVESDQIIRYLSGK